MNYLSVDGVGTGESPALADEVIVISGHFDHLGVRAPRDGEDADADLIYNGADDDASGTAAVIELAEAFAAADSHLASTRTPGTSPLSEAHRLGRAGESTESVVERNGDVDDRRIARREGPAEEQASRKRTHTAPRKLSPPFP